MAWRLLWNEYASFRVYQFQQENTMFGWAISFLLVAIIAGIFGFSGIAGTVAGIAKILFVVGLVMFLALLVTNRRAPPF
jgi:uncharacterized membrane protein YtjA (UPF0391 family)